MADATGPPIIKEFDLNYPDAEIVIGLVYAVGTEYEPVQGFLEDQIRLSGYDPHRIKISDYFAETASLLSVNLDLPSDTPYKKMDGKIRAGNALRSATNGLIFVP